MRQTALKQRTQTRNESMSKADGPSLISRNLFVAWSRDSVHKSIHYLNTEVQGSSTSWLDQACKWCMHFPVQTHKTDIQHPQNFIKILKIMKTKVSGRPNGHWFAGHFSVDLWGRFLFFSQPCLVLKYLMIPREEQPFAARRPATVPPGEFEC